jgi:hypothetical protein
MTVIDINEQRKQAQFEKTEQIIQNSTKFIVVTFEKEGIHCYPDAATNPKLATNDWDDVSFLANPHRHIFKFRVEIEVFHNDRELEFIQVKRQFERWLGDGTLILNNNSCEMISDQLFKQISFKWPDRRVAIEVSEDGENGSIALYSPTDINNTKI